MKKKINYAEIMKETGILTVAVAIIAAAVYFFLVPSHASVSSISGLGHTPTISGISVSWY